MWDVAHYGTVLCHVFLVCVCVCVGGGGGGGALQCFVYASTTYGYPNSDVNLDSILLNVLKIQNRQGAMTEAVALYDYQTVKNGRVALKKDDRITNITKVTFTIRNIY